MLEILDSRWYLFVKVAELGSITNAASALNKPFSVISRQIAKLEEQCGGRLFRRTGRGVVLTEFGEVTNQRICALIQDAEQLADLILATSGVPIGEVHVGILPSAVPTIAGKLFKLAKEKFPRIRLHLMEAASSQLEELLSEGRLDVALLLSEKPAEELNLPILLSFALDLIGPPNDPLIATGKIAFKDLEGVPLILPAAPHVMRKRLDMLAREHNIQLKIEVEADTIQLQREISATGIGYAIVASPSGFVGSGLSLAAARIVEPELIRHIVLGTTQHRPHTLATRSISDLIKSLFAEKESFEHCLESGASESAFEIPAQISHSGPSFISLVK